MEYSSSPEDGSGSGLFREPEGYYAPDQPATFVKYTTRSGTVLNLRLVGHNPLWGHLLWNAGQVVARYLELNAETLVKGKSVLELGAGAGLPSLVCALYGAKVVVVTDYPDHELIANLRYNISHASDAIPQDSIIEAEGFLWGSSTDLLINGRRGTSQGFDLLILADILFNHSEHGKLIRTLRSTLKADPNAKALVFFTPYRPRLMEKDLDFFTLAENEGMQVKKLFEHVMEKVMFPDDPGDETLRRTVFAYEVSWFDSIRS